ncbi:unnamed protein product [Cuscuta europaea]|uniref:Uncharacterized protein n=1 Tax=Cuscuta europaea TaxID=41803 RepID=A0A9P0YIZ5_CUSEU|nr:unnamed protein product [Cuscuta europaea]
MNKRQSEEKGTVMLARPPLEPPPWSAGEFRIWNKTSELCFNSFLFCLCFYFELHVILVVFLFPVVVLLIDRVSVPVILGLILPVSGLASYVALNEVADSKSIPRAHDWICKSV